MNFNFEKVKRLPPEQQERFAGITAEIVCESFVFSGDRDYLTARFAFFQKQSHLFFWAASQAVEKYLKANTILLKQEPISRNHRLNALFNGLKESHPERTEFHLKAPDEWAEQGLTYWPQVSAGEFLNRLERIGAPDVRYDQVKLEETIQDLVLLDRLAFSLRADLIHESVQACQHVGQHLLDCFLDLNYPFAPVNYSHPSLEGITLVHHSVSTLEAALNGCYGHASLFEEWAIHYLALSPGTLGRLLNTKK